MRLLAFAVAASFVIPSPAFSQQAPMTDKPAPFVSREKWAGGFCWGQETTNGLGIRRFVVYDYKDKKSTTQTTLPRLGDDEHILGKECHADATLIFTNNNLLVFPGAKSLAFDPVEERTWWPYSFDSPLVAYIQPAPLKFVGVFSDGAVYSGQVIPEEKRIAWKPLGELSSSKNIKFLAINQSALIVKFENGKEEKFEL